MKKMTGWLGAAVLSVTLATGSIACAKTNDVPSQAQTAAYHENHGTPGQNMDKRVDRMKQKLGLSDAQVTQIKNIYAANQTKLTQDFQNMKAQTKGSDQAKAARQQIKTDMDAINAQVRGVLTADQQTKWDQFQKDHQHKGHEHKS